MHLPPETIVRVDIWYSTFNFSNFLSFFFFFSKAETQSSIKATETPGKFIFFCLRIFLSKIPRRRQSRSISLRTGLNSIKENITWQLKYLGNLVFKKKMQTRRICNSVSECSGAWVSGTSSGKCIKLVECSSPQNLVFLVCLCGQLAPSQKYRVCFCCRLYFLTKPGPGIQRDDVINHS